MAVPLCETFIPDGFPSFSGVVNGSPIARTAVSNEFPSFGEAANGSRMPTNWHELRTEVDDLKQIGTRSAR